MTTSTTPPLPWSGKHIKANLLVDNQPQSGPSTLIKSMTITEDAQIHEDEYLGQETTRFDKTDKGYSVAIELDTANMALQIALKKRDTARRNNQRIPEIALNWSAVDRATGQTVAFFLVGIEGTVDTGFGGRTERVKTSLKLKASDFLQG